MKLKNIVFVLIYNKIIQAQGLIHVAGETLEKYQDILWITAYWLVYLYKYLLNLAYDNATVMEPFLKTRIEILEKCQFIVLWLVPNFKRMFHYGGVPISLKFTMTPSSLCLARPSPQNPWFQDLCPQYL